MVSSGIPWPVMARKPVWRQISSTVRPRDFFSAGEALVNLERSKTGKVDILWASAFVLLFILGNLKLAGDESQSRCENEKGGSWLVLGELVSGLDPGAGGARI